MSNLRTSPSGKPIVGQNQDDVLLWDVATQTWIPGASPGGGGAGPETDEGDTGALLVVSYATGTKLRLANVDQNTTIEITPPTEQGCVDLRLTYGGAFTVAFTLTGGAPIYWNAPFVATPSADWDLVTFRWGGGVMTAAYSPGGYNS